MEMLCPECLTPLVLQDDSIAICPTHGGAFRVLFTRRTAAPLSHAPAGLAAASPGAEATVEPPVEVPTVADISIHESVDAFIAEPHTAEVADLPQQTVVEVAEVAASPVEESLVEESPVLEPPSMASSPSDAAAVLESDDFDIDLIDEIEPPIETEPAVEAAPEFVDQAEAPSKSPSALEAAVESLAEKSTDLDFDEQPFVAEAAPLPTPPPLPAIVPVEEVKSAPAPVAAAPIIPAPPPRPVLNKNKTRAQPKSDLPAQRLPPTDPFEVASPATKPLPAAAFGGGVEIPNPARAGAGTRSKPAARPTRPGVAPKLPPAPPLPSPPPATPVWDGPRPVQQPAHAPVVTPQPPTALKPRQLGNCKIHRNVPAIAVCRSCGAGVCAACDTLIGDKIHQCPVCKAARMDALAAGRKKVAKWSIGLAIWSAIGLALLASGATRGFAGTESAFDVAMLILAVIWIFSQIAGLALAIVSYSGHGTNSRAVWIALILNLLLIAAWIMPFMRLLKLGKE